MPGQRHADLPRRDCYVSAHADCSRQQQGRRWRVRLRVAHGSERRRVPGRRPPAVAASDVRHDRSLRRRRGLDPRSRGARPRPAADRCRRGARRRSEVEAASASASARWRSTPGRRATCWPWLTCSPQAGCEGAGWLGPSVAADAQQFGSKTLKNRYQVTQRPDSRPGVPIVLDVSAGRPSLSDPGSTAEAARRNAA